MSFIFKPNAAAGGAPLPPYFPDQVITDQQLNDITLESAETIVYVHGTEPSVFLNVQAPVIPGSRLVVVMAADAQVYIGISDGTQFEYTGSTGNQLQLLTKGVVEILFFEVPFMAPMAFVTNNSGTVQLA